MIKKFISVSLILIILLNMVACENSATVETPLSEEDIMQDVDSYFDISVEFQNIRWESTVALKTKYYTGYADMHIKIINKKHLEGVSLAVKAFLKNTGDNKTWVDAYYLNEEIIEKTIYVSDYGITDVVIPRVSESHWEKCRTPNDAEIRVEVKDISIDK